jgi:ligand-binding sensor domain-containing protein
MKKLLLKKYRIILLVTSGLIALGSSCDKEVTTSEPLPLPPEGKVVIYSKPIGYDIYLNGKKSGKQTPDSLNWLEETTHKITLKKEFFKDTSVIAENVDSSGVDIFINYYNNNSMYGKVRCLTKPSGADVFIDDSATGKETPHVFTKLWPGHHEFKFKYPEHRTDSIIAVVKSSELGYLTRNLVDTSNWVSYQEFNSNLPTDRLTSIVVIRFTKWIGTQSNGLLEFSEGECKVHDPENSILPSFTVTALYLDDSKNLWIATDAGIVKKTNDMWTVYNKSNSQIPSDKVTSITADNFGNIWISTQNGIAKFEGGSWTAYTSKSTGSYLDKAQSLAFDHSDTLWVATLASGITKYDGNNWVNYDTLNSDIPGFATSEIAFDQLGDKWVGFTSTDTASGSLGTDRNGIWTQYLLEKRINQFKIYQDDKWVCTSEGLHRFEYSPSDGEVYTVHNSPLKDNFVTDIYFDINNHVWITTFNGGLVKFKNAY